MTASYCETPVVAESASAWTRFKIDESSKLRTLLGTREIWANGDLPLARERVRLGFGFDPLEPYCPCPSHRPDEVVAEVHEIDGIAGLGAVTLEQRNARIDRSGNEVQAVANPRLYRTPNDRQYWLNEHPYQTVDDFIFNNRNVHVIFNTKSEYDDANSRRRNRSRSI